MSYNKCLLLGRLGKDPELKYTASGTATCKFSLATSEKYKDKTSGELVEKTQWHNVVVWGKAAELSNQYLAKGRQAFVEGKIENRSWDDKDGNKKYITEIIASTVQFIGSNLEKNEAVKKIEDAPKEYEVKTDTNFASDSIPF